MRTGMPSEQIQFFHVLSKTEMPKRTTVELERSWFLLPDFKLKTEKRV